MHRKRFFKTFRLRTSSVDGRIFSRHTENLVSYARFTMHGVLVGGPTGLVYNSTKVIRSARTCGRRERGYIRTAGKVLRAVLIL